MTQGYTMQTDWTDGAKIKAAYDLAKQLGQLDTDASDVRDRANVTHACTVADLLSISAQIGTNYLALLHKKWGYVDQINAIGAAYVPGASYAAGDIVSEAGALYQAPGPISDAVFTAASWTAITEADAVAAIQAVVWV